MVRNVRKKANYTFANPSRDMRSRQGGNVAVRTAAEKAAALVDPFCEVARGSKIPDHDSSRSVAFQLKWAEQFNTTGSGEIGANFRPNLSAMRRKASTFTGTSIATWQAADTSPDYSAISSAFSEYRIVSWGIRVINLVAPTDQSGYVRFITHPADPTAAALPFSGGLFAEVHDLPAHDLDAVWISKPLGSEWTQYEPIGGYHNWENVTIVGTGWPSSYTGAVRVEVVFNIEAVVSVGSISSLMSSPAADHSPVAITTAEHTKKKHPSVVRTKSWFSVIGNALWEGAKSAVSAYAPGLVARGIQALTAPTRRQIMGPTILEVD